MNGGITDVDGIKVGHFTDSRRPTGCTVILYEAGAIAGVDVRGSAPGTRETDLLKPANLVEKVHAIVLSGGSAFGLDAASGAMRYLEEQGAGFQMGAARIPIVPAAILYDLDMGDWKIRPDAEAGYQACLNAGSGSVEEGSVGAGAGATFGKAGGGPRMKGGIGSASMKLGGDIVVGAIVAVNAFGHVIDPKTGQPVAGMPVKSSGTSRDSLGQNTTIGVVATNARLTKTQMTKVAEMAHDGLARAINPSHTPFDGDTIFAITTAASSAPADLGSIGAAAADVAAAAVVRAVTPRGR